MLFPFCPRQSSPAPFYSAGVTGEVGLPAENGKPGEDMEEALVCPETGTDYVLQVAGETLLPQGSVQKDPTPDPVLHERNWKQGRGQRSGRWGEEGRPGT